MRILPERKSKNKLRNKLLYMPYALSDLLIVASEVGVVVVKRCGL